MAVPFVRVSLYITVTVDLPGTVPVWLYSFQYTTVTANLPGMAIPLLPYVRVHMKHVTVAIACDCCVDHRCTAERIRNVLCSCVL